MRLSEAHLSHNRSRFEVSLICDNGDSARTLVAVDPSSIPLLVPYLILLRDSEAHPLDTEPPVVPVILGVGGLWVFCHARAALDQEPVPPEPGRPSSTPPPRDRLTYVPACPTLESVD
jgi:hypothetical protein